jgi:AcrR family transcriptional regulator
MRTERTLQQAALDLFAKQGYDDTTTEEIAERAGVSPRTFFRYFPTKESVLFVGQYGWFQSLTKQFLAQPASLNDFEALRETLLAVAPSFASARRSFVLYERAIASSGTLRGRVHDNLHDDITTIANAIATRRGLSEADEGCALLAAVVLATHRRALTRWVAGSASVDPADVLAEEFDLLLAQFAPVSSNGRRAGRAKRPARPRTA